MNKNLVISILEQKYTSELVNKLIDAFIEIENNYFLRKWQPSELNSGHFVEAMRRIVEFELLEGNYTPIGSPLRPFNNDTLLYYENQQGHDSFRKFIPRTLKAIYNIRNHRGVGHLPNEVSPNEMDATYILFSVKWVIAETIRIIADYSPTETQRLVDTIVDRSIPILWRINDSNGTKRLLKPGIPVSDQILIFLYDESPLFDYKLISRIEYKDGSYFRNRYLRTMHQQRLIEYVGNECILSPLGRKKAEKIIRECQILDDYTY